MWKWGKTERLRESIPFSTLSLWISKLYLHASFDEALCLVVISSGFYSFNPQQKRHEFFFSSCLFPFYFWKWHTENLPFSLPLRLVSLSQARFLQLTDERTKKPWTCSLLKNLTNQGRHQRMLQIDSLIPLNQHQCVSLPYFTLSTYLHHLEINLELYLQMSFWSCGTWLMWKCQSDLFSHLFGTLFSYALCKMTVWDASGFHLCAFKILI